MFVCVFSVFTSKTKYLFLFTIYVSSDIQTMHKLLSVRKISITNPLKNNLFQRVKNSYIYFCSALHTSEWKMPEGYDAGIKVYNSIIREKVPLILKNKQVALWYTCGPTVYSDAHIGHASCYVKFDIIRKIMEKMFNINVVLMMGITDIDDKIISRASKECCSIKDIATKYEKDFFLDMEALNVQHPSIIARVTHFIPHIIDFCKVLLEKDYAYVTKEGNMYFIVSKTDARVTSEDNNPEFQQIIDPLKKDPRDFALWKVAKPGEPSWESPWGPGRPGWHIECSTMASFIFGNNFDIHTGGIDLIFPHHMNEKSQSEAYHSKNQWVNYWLHAGILHVEDDTKMSKSLGNIITIQEYLKTHSPNVFRFLCLQSTYRNNIEYSSETVELAKNMHNKFHVFLNDIESYLALELVCSAFDSKQLWEMFLKVQQSVTSCLCDDFNTSEALKHLVDLISRANSYLKPAYDQNICSDLTILAAISAYINRILEIFGVNIMCKKKLGTERIHFAESIVKLRSIVRQHALNFTSFENIENTTESLLCEVSTLRNNIILCEPLELEKGIFGNIVIDFCDNIESLSLNIVKASNEITNRGLSESELKKEMKKIKTPLLKACDEFRDQLETLGVVIKDMKSCTIWFPSDTILKIIKMN